MDSVPMLVSIFPINYQLRAHEKAGRHKCNPSLNAAKLTTINEASGLEKTS